MRWARSLWVRAQYRICFTTPDDPIPYWEIARGKLAESQAQKVVDAAHDLRDLPIVIDPQPSLTVSQIAARARKHARALERQGKTLDVVYVDHIHIIKPNDRYRGNRTAEITEISGALKALAKELNVAVVGLAQLNRAVEGRDDKRPTMADLRDSGSLEQDADLIVFLYREEYYLQRRCSDPNSEDRRIARLAEVRNKLELIIAKQRNGPPATSKSFSIAPAMPPAIWRNGDDRRRLYHDPAQHIEGSAAAGRRLFPCVALADQ